MKIVTLGILLGLSAAGLRASVHKSPVVPKNPLVVTVETQDWLTSYLDWTHKHPATMKRDAAGDFEPLTLPMPYVELFSPSGESLYRGGIDRENAAFLDGLKRGFPSRPLDVRNDPKPTLPELLDMVPTLRPYRVMVTAGHRYTLFAITYPDKTSCRKQNEAMHQIIPRGDLQIVEMDLRSH